MGNLVQILNDRSNDSIETFVQAEDVSFADLGLPEAVVQGFATAGHTRLFFLHRTVLLRVMQGVSLVVQAPAGADRTLLLALVALLRINPSLGRPQAMVLSPTRESAAQIQELLASAGRHLEGFGCQLLTGAAPQEEQEVRLRKQPSQVVVGTPARVLSLLQEGSLGYSHLRLMVLDQVDRLLGLQDHREPLVNLLGLLMGGIQVRTDFPRGLEEERWPCRSWWLTSSIIPLKVVAVAPAYTNSLLAGLGAMLERPLERILVTGVDSLPTAGEQDDDGDVDDEEYMDEVEVEEKADTMAPAETSEDEDETSDEEEYPTSARPAYPYPW